MLIDYSKLKSANLPTWRDLYDKNSSLAENFISMLEAAVELPYPVQYQLIAAYTLTPSALANILPILVLYGQRGTGKSTTGQLISYLHGVSIHTGADTFAAIRNDLNSRRWKQLVLPANEDDEEHIPIAKKIELNTILVWDDIDAKILIEQPNIFRMLKSGYNKATDTISIAGTGGRNIKFNCFSPKIVSSTTPIWGDSRFSELERRILVVKFGKAVNPPSLKLESYDWHGFEQVFKNYWNIDRAKAWLEYRLELDSCLDNTTRSTITLDLMATGLTVGLWSDTEAAINYFEDYWKWYELEAATGDSALTGLLKQFINDRLNKEEQLALKFGCQPECEIDPRELKKMVDSWYKAGMLEVSPNAALVNQIMNYLGWRLIPNAWTKMK